MPPPNRKARAKISVQRVKRIDRWLVKAGVQDPDTRARVAIDISDSLDAADWIRFHLSGLLRTDPNTRAGADRALHHAVGLGVWAFSELRYHILRLQRSWDAEVESVVGKAARKRRSGRRPAA